MLDRLSVETDPFPRLSGTNLVKNYGELRRSWPEEAVKACALRDKAGVGYSPLARLRGDELKRLRKALPPIWIYWLDHLHSPEFKQAAVRYFSPLIRGVFGHFYDFKVRAQLVECTPRAETHRVIGPHVDTERTLWVVEIFFPHPEDADTSGGFDYYRWKGAEDWIPGTVKANPEAVELISTVEYKPGNACGFVNSERSLHSSGLRNASSYPRRYVSVSGHTKDVLFRRR